MKEYSSKVKFTSSDIHLKSIFSSDYYLELGNIDISVMNRLLNYEGVNINEITYYPIQNKGLGTCDDLNGEIKDKIPFMFFKNLNEKDRSKQLFLTYGLLDFYNANLKDRFIPVFLLPIDIYYSAGDFYIQLISKPFENPLMLNVFGEAIKNGFKQIRNFNSLYALDYALGVINRIPGCNVKLENYITFGTIKKRNLIEVDKLFSRIKLEDDFYITKMYGDEDNYYMSCPYTKTQRKFLVSAMKGNNLTLSGHDGTGKTTVLKDICINKINDGNRVLYITNKKETVEDIKATFKDLGLEYIVADMTGPFSDLFKNEIQENEYNLISIDDLVDDLLDKYNQVEIYEQIIGGRIADFRFGEILDELGVLVDLDHNEDKILAQDDLINLDFIYKHDYIKIKSSLENIQSNLYRLDSFKNNVWKEIPIINNIKYANQIINLITQINQGYEKLVDFKEKLEKDYGIREILNYADFRKIVYLIDGLEENIIPKLWTELYVNYKEASGLYNQLKSDIYNYQESKYYLNSKYSDLDSVNIKTEIKKIHSRLFTEKDNSKINNVIKNNVILKDYCDKGIASKKIYDAQSHNLRAALHWSFTDSDEQIVALIDLINLISDNELNLRLCMSVIDDKYQEVKDSIESLRDKISKAYVKVDKMVNEYPNLDEEKVKEALELIEKQPKKTRSVRKKFNNITIQEVKDLFANYLESLNKIKKLKEKYYVASGFKYDSEVNPIVVLDNINEFYCKYKNNSYSKMITKFLESIDTRKRNGKFNKLCDDLNSFKEAYLNLNEVFSVLENNDILRCEKNSFLEKLSGFDKAVEYVNDLYETNKKMVKHINHLDEEYVKYESYLHLNSVLDEHDALLKYLQNNKTYKHLYGYLYEAEKTNVTMIAKVLQIYSEINSVFKSSDDLIKGFSIISEVKQIISECDNELNELNEVLKMYARIFRDGVSRYYYNNFNSIIEYLNSLLSAREDLIAYLSITSGLSVLNDYNLKSLIDYIVNTEKCDNIVNNFELLYFDRLKNKYLNSVLEKYPLLSDDDFIKTLDNIYELEEKIRNYNNKNIVKEIYDKTSHRSISHYVKNRDFSKYVKVNNGKCLCIASGLIVENWLNLQEFDVVIIDDAELLNSISYLKAAKNMQVIIAGSYHVHKAVSSNLLSLYFDDKTIIFKERFYDTPKKLLSKCVKIDGIIKSNILDNDGVEVVTDGIENYIYNLYLKNKDVKINYLVKEVDKVKRLLETLAKEFVNNNIECKEILDFINKNINITDLLQSDVINADYNILDISDYLYLDSNVEATNAYDRILLPSQKLVIYDKDDKLSDDSDLPFFSNVKSLLYYENNDELFDFNVLDERISIIINSLKEKNYVVYPASGNVNILVSVRNKFMGFSILFSNNSYSEVLNYYRQARTQYSKYGWRIVFINKMSYINGLSSVSNQISTTVEKKNYKKGK